MKRTVIALLVISALTGLAGCTESFNPDGPYDKKLVVYGVLSDAGGMQIIRVYATYPPQSNPGYAPSDNQVTDAIVTVARGGTVYQFHDTTIARTDTSRYRDLIRAKVTYGFVLAQNARYALSVQSPEWGKVTAAVTSLYRGNVAFQNPGALTSIGGETLIAIVVTPGQNAAAYIVRLYVIYDVHGAAPRSGERVEIPVAIRNTSDPASRYIYPVPVQHGQGPPANFLGDELALFSVEAYRETMAGLKSQAGGDTIVPRTAVTVLTQLDSAMYAYYNASHGFPESGTLRIDQPDYTNIVGGLGIFATTTVDSAFVNYPKLSPSLRRERHGERY